MEISAVEMAEYTVVLHTCWQYVSASEIQMGCSHSCKKRKWVYPFGPCHPDFKKNKSRIFTLTVVVYSGCYGTQLAAFACGELCICFAGEKSIDDDSELKSPSGSRCVGRCYKYKNKDQMKDCKAILKEANNKYWAFQRSKVALKKV